MRARRQRVANSEYLARRLNGRDPGVLLRIRAMKRASIASLVAAVALAATPAIALGQDAGPGQYTDPLEGNNPPSNPAPPSTPSSPSPGTAPSPGATASAGSPAGATASTQVGGTNEIPRTGFPVGMLMFAGALCLCGGAALRRAAGTTGA
jgi:hypothetical protein